MIPYIQYGLGVYKDGVYIRYVNSATQKTPTKRKVKSVSDFQNFIKSRIKKFNLNVDDLFVMCSSSMDFPEESTSNKKVIALAHALR